MLRTEIQTNIPLDMGAGVQTVHCNLLKHPSFLNFICNIAVFLQTFFAACYWF